MNERPDPNSQVVAWVLIASMALAGCATTPPPPETEARIVSVAYPVLAPLPETPEAQEKDGVEITVAPVPYRVRADTTADYRPLEASFSERMSLLTRPESAETHRYVEEIRYPVLSVEPDNLRFLVTINNHMDRVFRGAGAVIQFNVGGQLLGIEQDLYSEFVSTIVPPRGEHQLTISGPDLSDMPSQTTVGLFIYDVVTNVDDAGTVTRKQNFEWYYDFSLTDRQQTVKVVKERKWVVR